MIADPRLARIRRAMNPVRDGGLLTGPSRPETTKEAVMLARSPSIEARPFLRPTKLLAAAAVVAALAWPASAMATENGAVGGAVAGAVGGAIVGGPVGLVVGGVGGAVVGNSVTNHGWRYRHWARNYPHYRSYPGYDR